MHPLLWHAQACRSPLWLGRRFGSCAYQHSLDAPVVLCTGLRSERCPHAAAEHSRLTGEPCGAWSLCLGLDRVAQGGAYSRVDSFPTPEAMTDRASWVILAHGQRYPPSYRREVGARRPSRTCRRLFQYLARASPQPGDLAGLVCFLRESWR